MTPFEKIYHAVSQIPKSKVATYKQIAVTAGITNPRVVGFAMRSNKDTKKIPCHRVIGSKGDLTGYAFGGTKKKKELLEKEGVFFLTNERVDLTRSLYQPN